MLKFIIENFATILVLATLVVITALIIIHMIKEKKKGKASCGCNCGGCPMSGSCHQRK